ncbi:hypothetical protein LCGC14_2808390 [marine sediment metagenome]|uniref:Uncharacterized protein n=1 Tax=marine sediment metagenome TaxID=412755 RepID=A0A0F8Z7H4_9ZZZZ
MDKNSLESNWDPYLGKGGTHRKWGPGRVYIEQCQTFVVFHFTIGLCYE